MTVMIRPTRDDGTVCLTISPVRKMSTIRRESLITERTANGGFTPTIWTLTCGNH
ncbi:hypothetical protein AB0873_04005 [Micromonospora sp. NPDC047707]|uniref:hypothetical protein n=1 Tax=unclassified Micromonospora TaxID=2617518 RepID=UPI0012B45E6B|nr:hypothetical protein [Micromonospora sp. WMMC415]QGN50307.1 hypothetical protein GKC29_28135 [Micromonospora sp. WMMC415]